jgi:hypothetical protein
MRPLARNASCGDLASACRRRRRRRRRGPEERSTGGGPQACHVRHHLHGNGHDVQPLALDKTGRHGASTTALANHTCATRALVLAVGRAASQARQGYEDDDDDNDDDDDDAHWPAVQPQPAGRVARPRGDRQPMASWRECDQVGSDYSEEGISSSMATRYPSRRAGQLCQPASLPACLPGSSASRQPRRCSAEPPAAQPALHDAQNTTPPALLSARARVFNWAPRHVSQRARGRDESAPRSIANALERQRKALFASLGRAQRGAPVSSPISFRRGSSRRTGLFCWRSLVTR